MTATPAALEATERPASRWARLTGNRSRAAFGAAYVAAVLVTSLDKQIALAKNPKAEGRRWFRISGNNAAFTVRFANKPLKLDGDDTELVVPANQLADIYGQIKVDAQEGYFDPQLAELEKMVAKRVEKMAATRAASGGKAKPKK